MGQSDVIHLDGSQGEGGGQIVRTAVTMSCITGTPIHIENVRANRDSPGLRPQHVTAIQAAAQVCAADVSDVAVGSRTFRFAPGRDAQPGRYVFRVGTAGSAPLVIQTVLLPLMLAGGPSTLEVHGGTHVPNSPSGHYLRDVYAPMLLEMGAGVQVFMDRYGWHPEGGGRITVEIDGSSTLQGLRLDERGALERVFGTAVACNLPAHIPQRITNRTLNLLTMLDVPIDIRPVRTRSDSTGAGIFLAAEFAAGRGGVGAIGRKGLPSEVVAEQAVSQLLAYLDSMAAVDAHLADQLVLPLAVAVGDSVLHVPAITTHLRTNVDVVSAFTRRTITIDDSRKRVLFEQ